MSFPTALKTPRPLITQEEAVARGLSRRQLAKACQQGRVRYYRPNGWNEYDALDVEQEVARKAGNSSSGLYLLPAAA